MDLADLAELFAANLADHSTPQSLARHAELQAEAAAHAWAILVNAAEVAA